MAQLEVIDLSFGYENSAENVFDHVSFSVDTNWKLGFIGRNGKGKTTFCRLLMKHYPYQGRIVSSAAFDYFPFSVTETQRTLPLSDFMTELAPGIEDWRVMIELDKLNVGADILYRPFKLLSNGEQTKALLAVLFSRDNYFLLIDEPTNHLDAPSREAVKAYLKTKKGFILISHDRDLLDAVVDHLLILNRTTVDVQAGNFSSWWENKTRDDNFRRSENEKHEKEIGKLKAAAKRAGAWADKSENAKIGFDPVKEHDRSIATRSYLGAKAKRMEKQAANFEKRIGREIEEKEGLLNDIEEVVDLKLMPTVYHKDRLIFAKDLSLAYRLQDGTEKPVLKDFSFELKNGDRIALSGENGSGKSSFIKAVLSKLPETAAAHAAVLESFNSNVRTEGTLDVGSGLTVSYINQDTGFLKGPLNEYIARSGVDESLFKAILRNLDFERAQFTKNMEDYSEGQKKKVLIAASLLKSADLYIWDEPLNYIDVFSRMQIEDLILKYRPTMIFVEHDVRFTEKIATKTVRF